MLRLLFGVLAGFVISTLAIIGGDMLLVRLFSAGGGLAAIPEWGAAGLQLGLALSAGLLGGWLTAWMAAGREWVGGGLLAAVRLLWLAASLPVVRGKQPEWYLVTLLVLAIGTALLGAALVAGRRRTRQPADATA